MKRTISIALAIVIMASTCGIITAAGMADSEVTSATLTLKPTLQLSRLAWFPLGLNENTTVNITSNGQWTATSNAKWLTLSQSSGTGDAVLTLTALENTGNSARTGTVTVKSGTITKTITVIQAKSQSLTLSQSAFTLPASSGSETVQISTSALIWSASSDSAWLTLSQKSGLGNGNMKLTFQDNTGYESRTGTVTITAGIAGNAVSKTVTLTQAGKPNDDEQKTILEKHKVTLSGMAILNLMPGFDPRPDPYIVLDVKSPNSTDTKALLTFSDFKVSGCIGALDISYPPASNTQFTIRIGGNFPLSETNWPQLSITVTENSSGKTEIVELICQVYKVY